MQRIIYIICASALGCASLLSMENTSAIERANEEAKNYITTDKDGWLNEQCNKRAYNDTGRDMPHRAGLIRHIKVKHLKARRYVCAYPGCEYGYFEKYRTLEHIAVKHRKKSGMNTYLDCPYCKTSFSFNTRYNPRSQYARAVAQQLCSHVSGCYQGETQQAQYENRSEAGSTTLEEEEQGDNSQQERPSKVRRTQLPNILNEQDEDVKSIDLDHIKRVFRKYSGNQ